MFITRRGFLQNGLAFVSLGLAAPSFLLKAASAAPLGRLPGGRAGKILVVIELAGGNDGLNTVIPIADPAYALLRPTLRISKADVVSIDARLGLHPKLKPLSGLYEKGRLAVVTGVGYPNPNRSHFQSMDIWQTGDPGLGARAHTGWLARGLDADGHFQGKPLSSLEMGGGLPLALSGGTGGISSVYSADGPVFSGDDDEQKQQRAVVSALYAEGSVAGSHAEFVRNVVTDAYASSDKLKAALAKAPLGTGDYPQNNDLASGLQTVARLITGGLETQVYYLSLGGFDTHANQAAAHTDLLASLGGSLAAFLHDLESQGRGEDVVVMTFSEFGRRAKENASAGTDHGAASVMLVAGAAVKGGVHGDYPSLTDLEDGDLRYHTDFRRVYATLLDRWIGVDSAPILGDRFAPLDIL